MNLSWIELSDCYLQRNRHLYIVRGVCGNRTTDLMVIAQQPSPQCHQDIQWERTLPCTSPPPQQCHVYSRYRRPIVIVWDALQRPRSQEYQIIQSPVPCIIISSLTTSNREPTVDSWFSKEQEYELKGATKTRTNDPFVLYTSYTS